MIFREKKLELWNRELFIWGNWCIWPVEPNFDEMNGDGR